MGVGKELDTKPLGGASDRVRSLMGEGWHWSHRFCTKCRVFRYAVVATADGHRRARYGLSRAAKTETGDLR